MAAFIIRIAKNAIESDVASIEVGTHSSCLVHLRDPIASAHHAKITRDESSFFVEDLGSSTGTWRNGEEVARRTALANGDLLVTGCTRIAVTLDASNASLQLDVQEQGFYFEPSRSHKGESGAMQVGGDAERWVRDEVAFGRFRSLSVGNGIALCVAALFLLALALPSGRAQVLQPGPLVSAHARLFHGQLDGDSQGDLKECFRIAGERGCSACHDALGGTPAAHCEACHAELIAQHHPFHSDRSAAAATARIALDSDVCATCHLDHSGATPADGTFIPTAEAVRDSCARCHAGGTEALPETRRPAPSAPVAHELAYDGFSHANHAELACSICHVRAGGAPGATSDRDFSVVTFERCMDCHAADESPSELSPWSRDGALAAYSKEMRPEQRVRLAWHGAAGVGAEPSNCLACHGEVYAADLRRVTAEAPEAIAFELKRRAHSHEFDRGLAVADSAGVERSCVECHLSGLPLYAGETIVGRFFHELHVASVRPAGSEEASELSETCRECHSEIAAAASLAGAPGGAPAYTGPPLGSCAECHKEDVEGVEVPLVVSSRSQGPSSLRERIDFPHDVHVRAMMRPGSMPESLAAGCFACHGFESGASPWQSAPTTSPEAADCRLCHTGHANVAGAEPRGCAMCHAPDDPVWVGEKVIRMRPETPGFSHWSRGHAPLTDALDCAECHAGVDRAQTISEVAVPSESDDACYTCHVAERFHWRGAPASDGGR